MKRSIVQIRILLMLTVIMSSVIGARSVTAQELDFEPDYFQSQLTDIEIELTRSDFEITEAEVQSYTGGEGELVQLRAETASIQIAFYDDEDTNLETMELFNQQYGDSADSFELLDQQTEGEVVSTFARGEIDDLTLLFIISVTEDVVGNVDRVENFYATEETFVADLTGAQETISIDGMPFLADVDAEELEAIAAGDGGGSGRTRDRGEDDDTRSRTRDNDEDDNRTRSRSRDDDTGDGSRSESRDEDDDTRSRSRDNEQEDSDDRSTRGRASSGETYEFEVVSGEMTVGGDVQVLDSVVNAPGVEQVQLQIGGTDAVAIVQLVRARTSAEATLDQILENVSGSGASLENIGTGADATSAWSLDAATSGGQQQFFLIYVDTDRYPDFHYVEVLLGTEANLTDDVDVLNSDVEIDGEGMFAGVNTDDLETLLDGGEIQDRQSGESRDRRADEPEEDQDEANAGPADRRIDARIDTGEDPGSSRDRSREREDSGAGASEIDLESQGLVSESEFESLQHGYIVEWDESIWGVDLEWELSATSDPESEVDTLVLFWLDGNASMLIQVMPSLDAAPADFVEAWESDDYMVDAVHEDAEVLISDSGRSTGAVVYQTYNDAGDELIMIQEVIDIDGGDTIAIITMFGTPDQIGDAYADAEDLITIDGLDLVGTFTPREIRSAVEP